MEKCWKRRGPTSSTRLLVSSSWDQGALNLSDDTSVDSRPGVGAPAAGGRGRASWCRWRPAAPGRQTRGRGSAGGSGYRVTARVWRVDSHMEQSKVCPYFQDTRIFYKRAFSRLEAVNRKRGLLLDRRQECLIKIMHIEMIL